MRAYSLYAKISYLCWSIQLSIGGRGGKLLGKKPTSDRSPVTKVQIRCEIKGEPAEFFLELKRRGIVASSRDAVVQGILCLKEKVLQRDLQMAQLAASRRLSEEISSFLRPKSVFLFQVCAYL